MSKRSILKIGLMPLHIVLTIANLHVFAKMQRRRRYIPDQFQGYKFFEVEFMEHLSLFQLP